MPGTNYQNGIKVTINGVTKTVTGNTTITKLAQTISGTYTQSEVQAISTKVDAIIQKLQDAGIIL